MQLKAGMAETHAQGHGSRTGGPLRAQGCVGANYIHEKKKQKNKQNSILNLEPVKKMQPTFHTFHG